jgi:hypothetical protein
MNTMRSMAGALLFGLVGCVPVRTPAPPDESTRTIGTTTDAAASLDEPLTAARALQVALARNPAVRAEMARLDAVEAERVQAGLLRNPMLSLMALKPEGGGRLAIEAGWMQSLFDLLTRSRRVALADANARREQAEVVMRLLDIGWQAQIAFHEAVAAAVRVRLLRSELALDSQALDVQTRWTQRGLSSQAELLRWQALRDEREHMLHEAGIDAVMAQSTLAMRMGLDSRQALRACRTTPTAACPRPPWPTGRRVCNRSPRVAGECCSDPRRGSARSRPARCVRSSPTRRPHRTRCQRHDDGRRGRRSHGLGSIAGRRAAHVWMRCSARRPGAMKRSVARSCSMSKPHCRCWSMRPMWSRALIGI